MKQGMISKVILVVGMSICMAAFPAHIKNSLNDAFVVEISNASANEAVTESYTLEQSIERAIAVNPRIRAAELEVRKAGSDVGQQRGDFFPTLSAQSGYRVLESIYERGRENDDYMNHNVFNATVRLSQPLFVGMTIFNSHQKALLNKARVEAWKIQVERELVLNIQLHFFELLKAGEDVKSLQDAIARLETNVEAAEAFHERRMVPYTMVLQAHVDLADARQMLSQAKNRVETTRVGLNILLDFSAYRNIDYIGELEKGSEFRNSLEECLDHAYTNRPEMEIAEKGIEIAEKDKKIALGQFSPRLHANVDYHFRDIDYDEEGIGQWPFNQPIDRDQKNEYWTAGVTLQWNFGLGGQQFYQYGKMNHEMERLKELRRESRNQITAEVRTYFLTLQETNERINTTKGALVYAREGYAMAKNRMDVRMGTVSELLDSQARLSRAEANYNQAIGDYLSTLARLNHAMGRENYSLKRSGA